MISTNQFYPTKVIHLFPKQYIEEWIKHEQELTFKKGELITTPKNSTNNTYILKKGTGCLFHIHVDGKECVVGLLHSGDFINLLDIFTEKESNAFSKALTDVTVISIPKDKVKKIIENTPSLAMSLLNHFSQKYQEMIDILEQIAYGKVEERLIFLLRKLADPSLGNKGWSSLPTFITHKDLAGMIASTRETVTLLITKLTQKGVIRQHDNKIWIQMKE